MRKLTILLVSLMAMNVYTANTQIKQLIDPAVSRGYLTWVNVPTATSYKLEFFLNDASSTQIAQFEFDKNYIKVDPLLFTIPNIAYTITALSNNSTIVSTTTNVVNKLPVNPTTWVDDCSYTCNGRTYAWKLTAGGRAEIPAEERLQLSNVYQYYDAESGVATPYWQAMSTSSYNSLPGGHPYKQQTFTGIDEQYLYRRMLINSSMFSGPTPYRDKFNNPVSDGFLIEKKLDEFTHLNGSMTVETAVPNTDICAVNDINYWKNFFNQYVDLNPVNIPSSVEPFAYTVPVGVECLETYDHTGVTSGDVLDNDWNAWVKELYESVDYTEEAIGSSSSSGHGKLFNELISQFNQLLNTSFSGDSVSFIVLESIDKRNFSEAIIKKDVNGYYLLYSTGLFQKGLYNISFRSAKGNVFPTVFKISSDLVVTQLKEDVDVIAYPNPIVNDQLNLKIDSKQALLARLLLSDNEGNLIINEEIKLKNGISNYTYDLSSIKNSNYLVLNVVYPDGSVDHLTLIKN